MVVTAYPVYAAVTFPDRPDWPVYEAPARWYIVPGWTVDTALTVCL